MASLPGAPAALVGRQLDVAELVDRVGRRRLLTVVGPGGIGKTSVALAVAQTAASAFEGRVYFVELADLNKASDVEAAIGAALHVRSGANRSMEDAIGDALAYRRSLLVLDNFEHVLEAADLVGRLLGRCRPLTALVTSRAPLRLGDEQVYELAPLSVADETSPGVVLFETRARAVCPTFGIDAVNRQTVVGLCRRLDGIPLAIELAASRVALLDPATLLRRLKGATSGTASGLGLLSSGARHRPARHRALQDTITWSYDLLAAEVKVVFRRLAVFEGGWTLDAAEEVCSAGITDPLIVLDGLQSLVEHHLVAVEEEPADGPSLFGRRFRLLETIREFAHARLTAEESEAARDELRARHTAYFAGVAAAAQAGLESASEAHWSRRLEREEANLRAAFDDAARRDDDVTGLRMAAALGRHWRNSGRWDEGRQLLRTFAERTGALRADRSAMADALGWIGRLDAEGGIAAADPKRAAEALDAIEEGLALHRELGEPIGLLRGIEAALAATSLTQNLPRARRLCDEGVGLSIEIGHRWWQAMLESWRGLFASLVGDLAEAERACRTCRALAEADGNVHMAGLGGWVLSSVLLAARRVDEAEPLLKESLRDNLRVGDRRSAAFCLLSLSASAMGRGDVGAGARYLRSGLLLAQESSDWVGAGFALAAVVVAAARSGQYERAAKLWGALRPDLDVLYRTRPGQRRGFDQAVRRTREALGESRAEVHAQVGEQLGWREVTADALAVIDAIEGDGDGDAGPEARAATPPKARQAAALANPDGLTRREIDVLGLVAAGLGNQEIAERLHVAVATVERHVTNLYRKIGARGRADAAVYAVRIGLLDR